MIDHSTHGSDPVRCVCLCGMTHEEIHRQQTARVVLPDDHGMIFPLEVPGASRSARPGDSIGPLVERNPGLALDLTMGLHGLDPVDAATALLARRR